MRFSIWFFNVHYLGFWGDLFGSKFSKIFLVYIEFGDWWCFLFVWCPTDPIAKKVKIVLFCSF